MTITKMQNAYSAPDVEVVVAIVELGFSQSNLEDPVENDPMDW